jgi:hypothetical protein
VSRCRLRNGPGRHTSESACSAVTCLELSDASGDEAVVIVDAFRWDPDGRITFSAYREDVPLEIIEWFTAEARRTMAPAIPRPIRRSVRRHPDLRANGL